MKRYMYLKVGMNLPKCSSKCTGHGEVPITIKQAAIIRCGEDLCRECTFTCGHTHNIVVTVSR